MNEGTGKLDELAGLAKLGSAAVRASGWFARWRAAARRCVHRLASTLAFALFAALSGFAALLYAAAAVLIANWQTHPVLAASMIALGFAVLSVLAMLLASRR